jgi:hypothetical protein
LRKTVERLMDIVQWECLGDALVLGPKGWCLKSKKVLYMCNSNSRRVVDGGEPGKGKVATSPSEVARVKEGRREREMSAMSKETTWKK